MAKISTEHFEALTDLVQRQRGNREAFIHFSFEVQSNTQRRDSAYDALQNIETELETLRATLIETYGDVDIDLTDGSIIEKESTEE